MNAAVGPRELRRAMSWYATGVAVVTTTDGVHDQVMTANSLTSVSLEPALVLLCVQRGARFHAAVLASGVWAANILPAQASAAAGWFATRGRDAENQLSGVPHQRGLDGVAVLDAAIATLECRTRDVHYGGDHDILVADVVGASAASGEARPLIYYRGGFHKLS